MQLPMPLVLIKLKIKMLAKFQVAVICMMIGSVFPNSIPASLAKAANTKGLVRLVDDRNVPLETIKECNEQYMPHLDSITRAYETMLLMCKSAAESERETAATNAITNIYTLNERTDSLVASLQSCRLLEKVDSVFECYANQHDNENALFSLAEQGRIFLNTLLGEYQQIENKERKCQQEAFGIYQKSWNTYATQWNYCVSGYQQ